VGRASHEDTMNEQMEKKEARLDVEERDGALDLDPTFFFHSN
jgi:hypothetical protein